MISVEERHQIIERMRDSVDAKSRLNACRGSGIDAAMQLAQLYEAAEQQFFELLNKLTDWGTPTT